MVSSLVSLVLPPQLEDNVALRTLPEGVLALDAEVYGVLVSRHITFLSKRFLAKITGPGLQFQMNRFLVSLETEVRP